MAAADLGVDSGESLWIFFIILIHVIDRFRVYISGASI